MSQEIIYTSAPKGLKPGSRGFCTVVSTAGMAKNLAERLESLSGYRHQFMPGEEGENPVNYSHLRFTVGGTRYHVLSRICDAGLDYTKRTNKLAHHIALTATETMKAPGGPAWAMAQDNFLVEQWDGQVKTLPESYRALTSKPCPVAKCSTWAALGIDAGWAGALAETAVKKSQPMTVIFNSGIDTLAMVCEALALIPPDKRWDITFTTYFTKLPAGVDCLWRFVPDGTPEASALRRNPHANIIDLCDPKLGPAPASDLADLARTGKSVQQVDESEMVAPATQSGRRRVTTPEFPVPPPKSTLRDAARGLSLEDEIDLPPVSTPLPPLHTDPRFDGSGRSKLLSFILAAALGVLIAVGMMGAYLAGTNSVEITQGELPTHTASVGEKTLSPEATPLPEAALEPRMEEYNPLDALPEEVKQSIDSAEVEERRRLEEEKAQAEASRDAPEGPPQELETAETRNDAPVEQLHKPFDHVLELNKRLQLPKPPTAGISSAAPKFEELAKLYVDDLSECDIDLRGKEIDKQGGREIITKLSEKGGVKSWTILAKYDNVVTPPIEVGTFQLANKSLQFRWAKVSDVLLQLCLLDIKVGNRKETCSLVNPDEVASIQLDFQDVFHRVDLRLNEKLPAKIEVSFEGSEFGEVRVAPTRAIDKSETAVIRIPYPKGLGEKKYIDVEVLFEMEPSNHGLRLRAFGYPLIISSDIVFGRGSDQTEPNAAPEKNPLSLPKLRDAHKICRDALNRLIELQRQNKLDQEEVRSQKPAVVEAVAKLEASKKRNAKTDALKEEYQSRIDAINNEYQQKVHDVAQEAKWFSNYEQLVKRNEQWATDMESFLTKLHNDGRVHFRVFVETEGVELDLIRSK